jgi:hypothetical protein
MIYTYTGFTHSMYSYWHLHANDLHLHKIYTRYIQLLTLTSTTLVVTSVAFFSSLVLVVAYFPTYLPIYETYFLQKWLPRWNQILTQMRLIHNWVTLAVSGWCTGGCWFFMAPSITRWNMPRKNPCYPPPYGMTACPTKAVKFRAGTAPLSIVHYTQPQ